MTPIRRRASLKNVAELAGVSIATASRVLNNTGYISEDTRMRVQGAAERLNYQPNLQAKGLRRGSSHTIGLLIPNLLNAYYTTLADAISQHLVDLGYQLLLSSTRDDPEIEQDMLKELVGHDVDGLIWIPCATPPRLLEYLVSQRTPTVALVRRVSGDALDTIVFEDFQGSKAAVNHLLQLGHRRIAYIGGDTKYSSNLERLQGYHSAMSDAGMQVDETLVKIGAVRNTWGSLAANELLMLAQPPTAIFTGSNAIMPGVMKTLRHQHISIPEEMSLICFDDLDWFSYSNPPISAVATSHERLAEAAIDLLLQRMNELPEAERSPVFMKINFDLVVRFSTAPPGQQERH